MDIRQNLTGLFRNNQPSQAANSPLSANQATLRSAASSFNQKLPSSMGTAQIQTPEEVQLTNTQAMDKLNRELQEAGKRFAQKIEKTENNFLMSYQGFEKFKEAMTAEYDGMDLSDLDIELKDGKLQLSSERLSDKQLKTLENHLTEDEELSELLKTTLTDITLLARHSPGQDQNIAFDIDESVEILDGALSLNKLVKAYNDEFERFHENSYTLISDQQLSGAHRHEPVLDHYQTFEERYQRDGLGQFVWLALADAAGYSASDSAINTRA